ncbi:PepSY domain-containing protein [Methanobacterium spitsbergense]|uniref:PepSY domain-containing protein n=1 Tax=Methanobacterium spitsbergense TaxID=2874285 RepID=A0A8T5V1C7_9EURY|nr:PepSY domain-containing protein [Methanobacterium spitsbergense]MBZ2166843.1 PepSY domain-containing protein [Methanobacterium spitsbergense]
MIVLVIILVAGLSLTVGLVLGNYLNKPLMINNTTNSSNSSTQSNQTNSTNQSKISNTKNNYISASEAIRIAKAAWPVSKATYYIDTYPTSKSPYYEVTVQDNPNIGPGGFVEINAITGEVIEKGT